MISFSRSGFLDFLGFLAFIASCALFLIVATAFVLLFVFMWHNP